MINRPKLITSEEISELIKNEFPWISNWAHLEISMRSSADKAADKIEELVHRRYCETIAGKWKFLK